jgi:hypothetical protein
LSGIRHFYRRPVVREALQFDSSLPTDVELTLLRAENAELASW